MKVDLIRKYKWYIVGLIMSFIMISVSLSFCQWDDNSINSLKASGGSGDYMHKYYTIAENRDNSLGSDATVGDIVTFGKYYQDDKEIIKTPLRWIVVDIRPNIKNSGKQDLYLLTESVVAFGNFDYIQYFVGSDKWVRDNPPVYNQRYNDSSIRAWLNSGSDWNGDGVLDDRTDGGEGFAKNSTKPIFNGFYREAFETEEEKDAIIPRDLGAMTGNSNKINNNGTRFKYDPLPNQKVWIPSVMELYGTLINGDAVGDKQFSYFNSVIGSVKDPKKVGSTTPFASTTPLSNFATRAATHQGNSQGPPLGTVVTGGRCPAWWWLRTPNTNVTGLWSVNIDGQLLTRDSPDANVGARPAICIAR